MTLIKPKGARVLIEIILESDVSPGGIFLPKEVQEKTDIAIIKEIGEVKDLKVGDKVVYDKFAGVPIKIDGKSYLVIREADIIATVIEQN
jgi:chaperonin GroES